MHVSLSQTFAFHLFIKDLAMKEIHPNHIDMLKSPKTNNVSTGKGGDLFEQCLI